LNSKISVSKRNVGGFMWKWVMDYFEEPEADKKYFGGCICSVRINS
jgi:hypothetical protein